MKKNIKQIKIGDKKYTFEFGRMDIIRAEEEYGFKILKLEDQLVSQSIRIWVAGLHRHHKDLSFEERVDLFEQYNEETGQALEVAGELIETVANFLNPTPTKKQETEE